MTAATKAKSTTATDYVVKDISLAEWGRKEIEIAETEMPGLMAIARGIGAEAAAQGCAHRRVRCI